MQTVFILSKVKRKNGQVFIGTSNIVVPGNKQSFPEAYRNKSRLHYYANLFNSLEINSSFYKVPMRTTFEKWSLDVPPDFRFTVKLWKEITHVKDLNIDLNHISNFLNAAAGIGNKKGCLLIQFPGKITLDYFNKVEQIIEQITMLDAGYQWNKAVEFRNASWYIGETYELLDEYGASMVLHDMPKSANITPNKKAGFINIRFHGPTGDYKGSYTDIFLKEKAGLIKAWCKNGKDVYVYFNNTIGNAYENAKTLQQMLQ